MKCSEVNKIQDSLRQLQEQVAASSKTPIDFNRFRYVIFKSADHAKLS